MRGTDAALEELGELIERGFPSDERAVVGAGRRLGRSMAGEVWREALRQLERTSPGADEDRSTTAWGAREALREQLRYDRDDDEPRRVVYLWGLEAVVDGHWDHGARLGEAVGERCHLIVGIRAGEFSEWARRLGLEAAERRDLGGEDGFARNDTSRLVASRWSQALASALRPLSVGELRALVDPATTGSTVERELEAAGAVRVTGERWALANERAWSAASDAVRRSPLMTRVWPWVRGKSAGLGEGAVYAVAHAGAHTDPRRLPELVTPRWRELCEAHGGRFVDDVERAQLALGDRMRTSRRTSGRTLVELIRAASVRAHCSAEEPDDEADHRWLALLALHERSPHPSMEPWLRESLSGEGPTAWARVARRLGRRDLAEEAIARARRAQAGGANDADRVALVSAVDLLEHSRAAPLLEEALAATDAWWRLADAEIAPKTARTLVALADRRVPGDGASEASGAVVLTARLARCAPDLAVRATPWMQRLADGASLELGGAPLGETIVGLLDAAPPSLLLAWRDLRLPRWVAVEAVRNLAARGDWEDAWRSWVALPHDHEPRRDHRGLVALLTLVAQAPGSAARRRARRALHAALDTIDESRRRRALREAPKAAVRALSGERAWALCAHDDPYEAVACASALAPHLPPRLAAHAANHAIQRYLWEPEDVARPLALACAAWRPTAAAPLVAQTFDVTQAFSPTELHERVAEAAGLIARLGGDQAVEVAAALHDAAISYPPRG